jgi:transcriptional regulator with XRE-family HTH domain
MTRSEAARRAEFSDRFRAARIAAGYTQQAAADRLGVPQPRIAEYESGYRVPTIIRMIEIVKTLKLEPAILFPEFWQPATQSTR